MYKRKASGTKQQQLIVEAGSDKCFIRRDTEHPIESLCLTPVRSPRPPCATITGVSWISDRPYGTLELANFDGIIPVVNGVQLYLGFYDCMLIDGMPGAVNLPAQFEVVEFRYTNYKENWVLDPRYGAGALGMERHNYPNFECPMESESGYLLLGCWDPLFDEDDEDRPFLLTAFKIPQYHTVFISPDTIHSKDHMDGLWKTVVMNRWELTRAHATDHVLFKDSFGNNLDLNLTSDLMKFKKSSLWSHISARSMESTNTGFNHETHARLDEEEDATEAEIRNRELMTLRRMGHGKFGYRQPSGGF